MEVLERFLAEEQLFSDIETVLSVMVQAGLLISVESVVESWISIMEHHASQRRYVSDTTLNEEMVIAVNGPELVHCDSIVKDAIKEHFKDSVNPIDRWGHFIRRSSNIKPYFVSGAVDRLRNQKPRKTVML